MGDGFVDLIFEADLGFCIVNFAYICSAVFLTSIPIFKPSFTDFLGFLSYSFNNSISFLIIIFDLCN